MGYKLLGIAVWKGGRWYLHRKYPGLANKATIAAVATIAAAVFGRLVAAQHKDSGEQ